jgi:hypothetical protein
MTKDTLELELSECTAIEEPLIREAIHASYEEQNVAEIDWEIGSDADQGELELRNQEDDEWEDVEVIADKDEAEESDDDVAMAMDEMYG